MCGMPTGAVAVGGMGRGWSSAHCSPPKSSRFNKVEGWRSSLGCEEEYETMWREQEKSSLASLLSGLERFMLLIIDG
ncbi:unnamed protein product, partial [Laminaria digitata]